MSKATIQLAKVGGAYIGAGVLALEAYNVLTATLDVPTWVYWLAILAVVSGLPLVMLAAIAQIREDDEIEADPWMVRAPRALLLVTAGMVLVGGGSIAYWVVGAEDGVRAREVAANGPSIAVMSFENLSANPDDAYFAEGLTGELTRVFKRVPDVRVMDGDAIAESKTAESVSAAQAVAEELGVRMVLGGSVQKAGDRIRVSAELVEGSTGEVLFFESYDRDLTDVFAVQDEISAAIVAELSPTVQGAKAGPMVNFGQDWGTENAEAYMHYLRGMSLVEGSTPEEAASAFQAALDLDPDFTEAEEALTAIAG